MNKATFLVWKKYQRRAEVLTPLLNAEVLFLPHLFRRKVFRPVDYFLKALYSVYHLIVKQPKITYVQSPPLYCCIPAFFMRKPYIIDAHNSVFQNLGSKFSWGDLPLSKLFVNGSKALIVHNHRVLELAQSKYPDQKIFNIPDPLCFIKSHKNKRIKNQVFVISSFDPDEPTEILIESISKLPDYNFIITADPIKLPVHLQQKLRSMQNIKLTGFLEKKDYHSMICKSNAVLVLTNYDLIQPSGACEALSSDTQLIIRKTPLIAELFGEWAILVDNSSQSIVEAIINLKMKELDLTLFRDKWNKQVEMELERLIKFTQTI